MKQKIPVEWIHCRACELLLEEKISWLKNVSNVKVSQKEKCIIVETSQENDLKNITDTIKELGYDIPAAAQKKVLQSGLDWIILVLIFIIIGMFGMVFWELWITQSLLSSQNFNFLMILLIGFVASISTCLAITWAVVVGISQFNTHASPLKIHSSFHIGRLLWFVIWWAILWGIGWFLWSFGNFHITLLALAGIVMVYMGFYILWIAPSPSKFLPFSKNISQKILKSKNPFFTPIIGAGTFFLPCGFTQGMQIYAASSGSALNGAIIMGAFALGTIPVLAIIGMGSSYFKQKDFKYFHIILWAIIIYLWILTLGWFSNLIPKTFSSPSQQGNYENVDFIEKKVVHNGWSLEESPLVLEAWKNYQLIITPTSNGMGCMSTLTIPWLDNRVHRVLQDYPIITYIKDAKPGKYNVVCSSMGMPQWEIIIE